jgi:hypothetical protein
MIARPIIRHVIVITDFIVMHTPTLTGGGTPYRSA